MVSFAVPGRPVPQGSLASFRHRTTGQIVTPQKARVREYRDRIAWAARAANVACTGGPVVISCTFAFARPKSHYTANGELGRRASVDHVTRPDVDKLARAALDAITNIWIDDDSQVVRLRASKVWADQNWTRISMRQVQR